MDIAAPGTYESNDGKSVGTSFAAPRVARAAAKVHEVAPDFSPDQIRLAILFSVDFDDEHILQVRSGGVLNEGEAVSLARWAAENHPESDLAWVQGYFCKNRTKSCRQIRTRLKHWQKTSLIGG